MTKPRPEINEILMDYIASKKPAPKTNNKWGFWFFTKGCHEIANIYWAVDAALEEELYTHD